MNQRYEQWAMFERTIGSAEAQIEGQQGLMNDQQDATRNIEQ